MRAGLIIAGAVVLLVGFIFTASILGAILGIPLILIGFLVLFLGLILRSKNPEIHIVEHKKK